MDDLSKITRRLDLMKEQLRKVFTRSGVHTLDELKAFIKLGQGVMGLRFDPWTPPGAPPTPQTVILLDRFGGFEQQFRLQVVNGQEHLFATEKLISQVEFVNKILLDLQYPRQYISEHIRNILETPHNPYDSLFASSYLLQQWLSMGLPEPIGRIVYGKLATLTTNWIDVDELFENARKVCQLNTFTRGLKQENRNGNGNAVAAAGGGRKSRLLNLPYGPADLAATFCTGVRGLNPSGTKLQGKFTREGAYNIKIEDQQTALLARLMPTLPEVGEVEIPYRTPAEYEEAARTSYEKWLVFLESEAARLRAGRNPRRNSRRKNKTRKNKI
jgi:hypothetical protein